MIIITCHGYPLQETVTGVQEAAQAPCMSRNLNEGARTSLIIDRHTVPEGYTFGWKKPCGNLHCTHNYCVAA